MRRKSKDSELSLDFLDNLEQFQEKRDLELFSEGLTLHEPSSITEEEGEAAWIKLQGATPLEFLRMVYINPWNDMKDRITAARSILDFCHRKLPQRLEVESDLKDSRKITAENLSKLSDEELTAFTQLLEKLGS